MGRRSTSCFRTAFFLFVLTFVWLQLHILSIGSDETDASSEVNDSAAAILNMVPPFLHKFLTSKKGNISLPGSNRSLKSGIGKFWTHGGHVLNFTEIYQDILQNDDLQEIYKYGDNKNSLRFRGFRPIFNFSKNEQVAQTSEIPDVLYNDDFYSSLLSEFERIQQKLLPEKYKQYVSTPVNSVPSEHIARRSKSSVISDSEGFQGVFNVPNVPEHFPPDSDAQKVYKSLVSEFEEFQNLFNFSDIYQQINQNEANKLKKRHDDEDNYKSLISGYEETQQKLLPIRYRHLLSVPSDRTVKHN